MKRNDSGDFSILYVEHDDKREALFSTIAGQQKPVVLLLSEQTRLFRRPEEFMALRHVRRQVDITIFFVIPHSDHLTQLAERCGFPSYASIDALGEALRLNNSGRQRILVRTDGSTPRPLATSTSMPRRTIPLVLHDDIALSATAQLPAIATLSMPKGNSAPAAFRRDPSVPIVVRTTDSLAAHPMPGTAEPTRNIRTTDSLAAHPLPSMPSMPLPSAQPQREPVTPLPMIPSLADLPTRPPVVPHRSPKKRNRFPAILISLMILALSAAGLASLLVFYHTPSSLPAVQVVGHVYFLSSGQLNEQTNQGIDDEVQVDLAHLVSPANGKSYYAWLLRDTGETKAISLGKLTIENGNASLLYKDSMHTNLLAITSRFLVTEENNAPPPMAPSSDTSQWRYYGVFSQKLVSSAESMPGMPATNGPQRYSYLDHLRHLLADDPMLDANQLPGGLNIWLYQNTGKVLEWTSSMRGGWVDNHDMGFVSRQSLRTLAYLDGLSYVSQDLPPNTPLGINDRLARIGLLEVNGPNQDPPDYLDSIIFHLHGLLQAGDSTPALRQQITGLISALNDVRDRLQKVKADALQIANMSEQQLAQPSTLNIINDMIENATYAYTGWLDPATGTMHQGVTWLYAHMQELATITITPYIASSSRRSTDEVSL